MSVPIRKDDAKTTVVTLQQKKDRGERITMLTAYDFPTARILDDGRRSTRCSSATRWRWWCSATTRRCR